MAYMLNTQKRAQLREAIQDVLKDKRQCHKFEEIVRKIIVDNISNLNSYNGDLRDKNVSKAEKFADNQLSGQFPLADSTKRGVKKETNLDNSLVPKNIMEKHQKNSAKKDKILPGTWMKPGKLCESDDIGGKSPRPSLIDHQKVHKLEISEENVHKDPRTGFNFQIYYRGKPIDKAKMERVIQAGTSKNESGQSICGIHEECYYTITREETTIFIHNLKQHIGTCILTYLCRACFFTCGGRNSLGCHFSQHLEQSLPKMPKIFMRSNSVVVMDYQKKFELNLSNENVLLDPSGYEYQIYYKSQAISEEKHAKIRQRVGRKTESGWILCDIHDNCSWHKPRMTERNHFNHCSMNHLTSFYLTFLCRYCFKTFGRTDSLQRHLTQHPSIL